MLRGAIGLSTLLAIVIPLFVGGMSLFGRRGDRIAHDPSLAVADIADGDSRSAVELGHRTEPSPESGQQLSVAVFSPTSIGRLVMGRRDRDSTHLDALLTCGRLLI